MKFALLAPSTAQPTTTAIVRPPRKETADKKRRYTPALPRGGLGAQNIASMHEIKEERDMLAGRDGRWGMGEGDGPANCLSWQPVFD